MKFKINVVKELSYEICVDANSKEEAEQLFWDVYTKNLDSEDILEYRKPETEDVYIKDVKNEGDTFADKNNPVSKSLFVETMENIKKQDQKINRFNDALNEICDGYPIFDSENLYLVSLLDLLNEIFRDEDDWIGWWLYEDVEKEVLHKGREINLNSAEQLYDFLVANMKGDNVL